MTRLLALVCCFTMMACAPPYQVVPSDAHPGVRTIYFDDFSLSLFPSWDIQPYLNNGSFRTADGYTGHLVHAEHSLLFMVLPETNCQLLNKNGMDSVNTTGYSAAYRVNGNYYVLPNNTQETFVNYCVSKQSFSRIFFVTGNLDRGAENELIQMLRTVRMPGNDY